MNQYHIYEVIGHGKYSTVYKGRRKKSADYFAIKSVDKAHKSKVLHEVKILHSLEHANILKFYSWYETSAHLWLVLEYCVGGDLRTLLEQDKLPEDSLHDLARDLVRGLRFLHSKGIIYCDLKPSNILLDGNGRTKLCDFGLSRKLSDISKTPSSLLPQAKRGTPCYMAPELFHDGGVHSYASDFWALGCVLYECYAGRPPFIGKEFTQLVKSIMSDPTPPLPGNPSRVFYLLPQAKRGTPCYMAPELFHDGGVHSYASDFWALGCVLYECYAGRPPFIGKEFTQLVKSIMSDPTPPLPGNPSRTFANLVNSLLIKDPAERIQWSEVCGHAYWNTKFRPLPLPVQPAFDNMIELCYKPFLTERNSNKTPPINRDNTKGRVGPNENINHNTPSEGVSSGRKIQSKVSSATKGVNLLRLSRIAKTNLQREKDKDNYLRPLPNNSENDNDVKIENTDMELDFNEDSEDDAQDEPEMTTPAQTVEVNSLNPDHDLVASPMTNTLATDDSRTDFESSSDHIEVPATPPSASPQPKIKRVPEGSEGAFNLSNVLWHTSDLSVRPVMPSKKSDKMPGSEVVPSLPFDTIPVSDFAKVSSDQLEALTKCIVGILNGNTTIGEKQNVIRYLEMLSCNVNAVQILTNGQIMPVLVKLFRHSKAAALRVQLASLLCLLIRHSTFIDDDLANSGMLDSLYEGLVDRQEKVRRFSMAALGELLFYISTQNDQLKGTNLSETPSKETRTQSRWQVPSTLFSLVTSLLRKGEDDITQFYALRTIENISSQGGSWATCFTSQDVINNLCYIFRAPGKQETMRLTAGSCLVRLSRFNPPTIQQVMKKLTYKETAAAISKGSSREQQICLNLLNLAMLGSNKFTSNRLHLIEDKSLVPNLISLIEHGGEVLRGKALVFVTLLCKDQNSWLAHFFFDMKLLSSVDRLVTEKGFYLYQCLEAFLNGVVSIIPGLLESIIVDIQQLLSGKRHMQVGGLTGRGGSKTNLQLFPVVLNLLRSASFKPKVVDSQGRDDFLLNLLRVLEAITKEPAVIEENHATYINEILPSLCVICKGSKDGDARILCLKIWFEVVVNMLTEAPDEQGREKDLKSICNGHFVPMYSMLTEGENPTPIYAQKILEMFRTFNIIDN